ncbi:hypothetical protein NUU61_000895 [Penicillium alfredii]|uniref:Uncharacterized protein n=1 Tax=Penicillium alfredii TaxID=1506179 RepID=A0A9W9GAF8_9EURO|nr:uncharacterized protein NUU61_000895 [Penicillium alfredii]KAJ5115136.1 hypothetical protein NUU61_000895 [Penicillium alfredii]
MANSTLAILHLDPDHISCIGGRTVLTCRSCAGNAPRYINPNPKLLYSSHPVSHMLIIQQRINLHKLRRPRLQHLRLRALQPRRRSCRRASQPGQQCIGNSKHYTWLICAVITKLVKPELVYFIPLPLGPQEYSVLEAVGRDELWTGRNQYVP